MFPWHSSLKIGWCSQQLISALLTFCVMGNKLGPSNMATSVLSIFCHLLASFWHFREEKPNQSGVSHYVTDMHITQWGWSKCASVLLMMLLSPPLYFTPRLCLFFSFFLSPSERSHSVHMLQPLANNSLGSWVVYFTHSCTATLV